MTVMSQDVKFLWTPQISKHIFGSSMILQSLESKSHLFQNRNWYVVKYNANIHIYIVDAADVFSLA